MTAQITTLPNGLRVVTEELPGIATATLGLWVEVGTRHESPEINGISHYLEHMAFKGTTTRTAKQIAEEIENVGGQINAYTSRENTAYHARVLQEDVPLALEIIADIIQNSIFDPEEIERERSVILQEIGQAIDTPDDIIFDFFQETAFPNHPMGRPVLGRPDIIQRITRDDLINYMKQEYTASRMVFAATGGVKHDQIVDLCQKYFTSLSNHSVESYQPTQYKGGQYFEKRDLEQVHLVLGYESCDFMSSDYFVMSVLSALLGGGMSSRLFQEIREKKGLVYSIYSFNSVFRDSGLFGIYAGTGPDQIQEVLPTIKEVLLEFSTNLTPTEINRSKAQIKAANLMALESTSARCEKIAQQMMIFKRQITIQELIDSVNAVTQDDIVRVAHKLTESVPTFVAIGPGQEIRWI
jgi:predicted Zn-dependent peptidase